MDPWTPNDRNEFISRAINSQSYRGYKGPYNYRVFPKANGNEIEDPKKSKVTEVLAKTIYTKNPAYRIISIKFYQLLVSRLIEHFTSDVFWNDIVVMLKGGNSYAFLSQEQFPEDFPFSDMDIVIYINPYLPKEMFENMKKITGTVVMQTISQYKRTLDHILFLNKPIHDSFITEELVDQFKKDFSAALSEIVLEDEADGFFMSPFDNEQIRNSCSKNSYMILNSEIHENSAVKIEIPHYDRCERIPLRKTPLFTSVNKTISFKRDKNDKMDGDFDLYRIRFNCMFVKNVEDEHDNQNEVDECDSKSEVGSQGSHSGNSCSAKEEIITADFIDVSIAAQNDAELIDFWNRGRSLNILEKNTGVWVVIPDAASCLLDLYKMLYVYECPEHKRTKREKKYEKLKNIVNSYYTSFL